MVEKHVLIKLVCCLFDWLVLAGIVRLAMDSRHYDVIYAKVAMDSRHYDVIYAKEQGRFIIKLKNTP